MARTRIDVCNEALAMVGADPIAALDDGSAEGQQCSAHYESTLGTALTVPGGAPMRWRFATSQIDLVRLAATPTGRWAYAYQAPPQLLQMHAVTQGGAPVPFELYGDKVFSDQMDGLVADFTFRPDEAAWPPHFAGCFAQDLAAKLALALNRDQQLAEQLRRAVGWPGARTADSQSRSSPRLRATRLSGGRFGGRSARW